MPSRQRPQCGRSPTLVSKSQTWRSKPAGRGQRCEWRCMRAVVSPSTSNFSIEVILLRRLDAALPVEQHDVARARHRRMRRLLDELAVASGDGDRRRHHALRPQRRQPGEFGGDAGLRVIAVAMHAKRPAPARRDVVDAVGGVLGEVDQHGRSRRANLVTLQRVGCELLQTGKLLLVWKRVEGGGRRHPAGRCARRLRSDTHSAPQDGRAISAPFRAPRRAPGRPPCRAGSGCRRKARGRRAGPA